MNSTQPMNEINLKNMTVDELRDLIINMTMKGDLSGNNMTLYETAMQKYKDLGGTPEEIVARVMEITL